MTIPLIKTFSIEMRFLGTFKNPLDAGMDAQLSKAPSEKFFPGDAKENKRFRLGWPPGGMVSNQFFGSDEATLRIGRWPLEFGTPVSVVFELTKIPRERTSVAWGRHKVIGTGWYINGVNETLGCVVERVLKCIEIVKSEARAARAEINHTYLRDIFAWRRGCQRRPAFWAYKQHEYRNERRFRSFAWHSY